MSKPTSLAAQLKRDDDAEKLVQDKEDREVAQRPSADGKVWVRLLRAHYTSEGILLLPGIAELDAAAVPSSAKLLTSGEAKDAAQVESPPLARVIAPADDDA